MIYGFVRPWPLAAGLHLAVFVIVFALFFLGICHHDHDAAAFAVIISALLVGAVYGFRKAREKAVHGGWGSGRATVSSCTPGFHGDWRELGRDNIGHS